MTLEQLPKLVRCQLWGDRDHPDFEDNVQEGWILAWQMMEDEQLSLELAAFRAARAVRKARRRREGSRWLVWQRPELVPIDEDTEAPAPRFEEQSIDRIVGRQLWRDARRLCTDNQFEALWLRNGLGMTEGEAAAAAGVSLAVLKNRHWRALCKCREALR